MHTVAAIVRRAIEYLVIEPAALGRYSVPHKPCSNRRCPIHTDYWR